MIMQGEERESALRKLTERYNCFIEQYKCVITNLRQGTIMLTKSFPESRRHWRKLSWNLSIRNVRAHVRVKPTVGRKMRTRMAVARDENVRLPFHLLSTKRSTMTFT